MPEPTVELLRYSEELRKKIHKPYDNSEPIEIYNARRKALQETLDNVMKILDPNPVTTSVTRNDTIAIDNTDAIIAMTCLCAISLLVSFIFGPGRTFFFHCIDKFIPYPLKYVKYFSPNHNEYAELLMKYQMSYIIRHNNAAGVMYMGVYGRIKRFWNTGLWI